eukprot:8755224-Ditylum_brightwellii.AAC.1
MVFYVYDANCIQGIPIKNWSAAEFQRVYNKVYEKLTRKGYKLQLHKMDNETSKELINWIEHQQDTRVELTPPDMHQQNLGERAI